ncbi:UDP-glycosyltransferase UGT5 [Anthophora quadrimaculata]
MKPNIVILLFVVCVLCVAKYSESARILAIVPTPSYSHQIPYRPLWRNLVKRGHDLVLITPNPIENFTAPNFKQIDISKSYSVLRAIDFVELRFSGATWMDFVYDQLLDISNEFSETVFNNTEMKELYKPNSNVKFDVVLVEFLYMPAIHAFAHRFNAPLIGLSSLGLCAINEHALGGLVLPSHEYRWEMEANTGSNLPFWKRLKNFVNLWRSVYILYRDHFPKQQQIAEKHLGPLPSLLDITKNMSMFFVNEPDVLTPASPKLTNMLTFSSFHIDKTPKPLPKDLQKFMDSAKDGVIYFSLGSNARSSDLPIEVQRMFCEVFAKLPYKVVWKYEKELPGKPDNVYTGKWLPQQTILVHPNVKLFIYQGGLQSTEETVHAAVPIIGFPILADQDYQIGRMEALGLGKRFDLPTVTKEEFESAIREVITNKEYKERMLHTRSVLQDKPYDLVDNLAWWTEYVIRTNGAPHLRSNLAWQPWYQRYDLDIVVFLTIVAFLIISNLLNFIAKLIVYVYNRSQVSTAVKQKVN